MEHDNSQAQRRRDDIFLDLGGSTTNGGQARVPEEALHGVIHAVAVATKDLKAGVGDGFVALGDIVFDDRRVGTLRLFILH